MSMVAQAAREAYEAGLCVLPVREDGTKAPAVRAWGRFLAARPTPEQMTGFGFETRVGYGMVAGVVSGCRECWDIDDPVTAQLFEELALAHGLGPILCRIRAGYEDMTPRGGRRWIVQYPADLTWRDCTLARVRLSVTAVKTLIELPTFAVLAPSHGPTHPTGLAYRRVIGGFNTIAAYDIEERTALVDLARTLDRMPEVRRPVPLRAELRQLGRAGRRPGDRYNERCTWAEVLEPLGWSAIGELNGVTYWLRPGKAYGTSATTNHGGHDLFHVFSSSTVFEPDRSYSKFGVYALTRHDGDFARAAWALARCGYGAEDDP